MITRERLGKAADILRFYMDDEIADFCTLAALNTFKEQCIIGDDPTNDFIFRRAKVIRSIVCEYLKASTPYIESNLRSNNLPKARAIICYLIWRHLNAPDKFAAHLINKDRCTVDYHKRKIESDIKLYPEVNNTITNLSELIEKAFIELNNQNNTNNEA